MTNYAAVLKQLTEERDGLDAVTKAIAGISTNGGGLRRPDQKKGGTSSNGRSGT